MCFAFRIVLGYYIIIFLMKETPAEKKHWQMAEVKTACCSLEAAQLDGLERPRLPIIKSAEFRTRPSKTRCLLSNKQQKKEKKRSAPRKKILDFPSIPKNYEIFSKFHFCFDHNIFSLGLQHCVSSSRIKR